MASDPLKYFRIEARELLEGLSQGILALEKGRASVDVGARLLRFAHTLKGAARVVRQPAIAELAHRLEDQVGPFRDQMAVATREQTSEWLHLVDAMAAQVALLGEPTPLAPGRTAAGEAKAAAAPSPALSGGPSAAAPPQAPPPVRPRPTAPAVERVEGLPVPAVSPGPRGQDAAVLREAARVAPQPLEGPEEAYETVRVDVGELQVLMDGLSTVSFQVAALQREMEALQHCRRLSASLVQAVGRPAGGVERGGSGPHLRADSSTDAEEKARCRAMADELGLALDRLAPALNARLDRWQRDLSTVRQRADRLRLVPCREVFAPLERAVRDAGQVLDRRVEFVASGGENRMEGHVLWALRDALLHVVRNAVAHGIEDEAQRRALGKPPVGLVHLEVVPMASAMAFVCSDDGRGIDLVAVRQAAMRLGLVAASAASTLSLQEGVELLLRGGVTTSEAVTEVSGRGVGLDVVREMVQRLRGEVHVESQPGKGTRLEIRVPLSLSSMEVLLVEVGGQVVAVPLDSVRRVLRVTSGDLARSSRGGSIVEGNEVIPFLPLSRLLHDGGGSSRGGHDGRGARTAWPVLVLASPAGLAAVGVDHILGTTPIVVHALPALTGDCPAVAGAALDHEGTPRLVLDPGAVVASVNAGQAMIEEAVQVVKPRILVVDDSLTTRMLEQSILESAGYEVDLATCGEEGLDKARSGDHQLLLVDVEMPGMNGFEFLERCGADAVLREIPAILVSSRNSPDDFRRGTEAGARAYIVKGEFDQGHFLQTIRSLMR